MCCFQSNVKLPTKKNLRKIQAGKINEASVEKIMEKEFVNWKSSEKKLSTKKVPANKSTELKSAKQKSPENCQREEKVKLQKNSPRKKSPTRKPLADKSRVKVLEKLSAVSWRK